jgi:hypothetical protein
MTGADDGRDDAVVQGLGLRNGSRAFLPAQAGGLLSD